MLPIVLNQIKIREVEGFRTNKSLHLFTISYLCQCSKQMLYFCQTEHKSIMIIKALLTNNNSLSKSKLKYN